MTSRLSANSERCRDKAGCSRRMRFPSPALLPCSPQTRWLRPQSPGELWWWSCGGRLCVTSRVTVHAQGSRTLRPSIVPVAARSCRRAHAQRWPDALVELKLDALRVNELNQTVAVGSLHRLWSSHVPVALRLQSGRYRRHAHGGSRRAQPGSAW